MGPTRLLRNDEIQSRNDRIRIDDEIEKDETELQLEKILFGDEAGFLNALQPTSTSRKGALQLHHASRGSSDDEEQSEGQDVGDMPDEELFFLDTGIDTPHSDMLNDAEEQDHDIGAIGLQPAWVDSDDEKLTISLSSNTRLRKLRHTEADDIVTGIEYVRRLRQQYGRLHPIPDWVRYARKKRKLVGEGTLDSGSDIEMGDSNFLPQAQPLENLLRSAGSIIRDQPRDESKQSTRKLRPETIDIQRLKDVTGHGPSSVDSLQFHPYFPLLLSAGPSSTINIYHVSPQPPNSNPLLTSMHIKKTPLHTAQFCRPVDTSNTFGNDQTRIFFSSRRRYFHTWALSTGTVSKVSRAIYGDNKHEQKTMEAFKLSPCGRYMGLVGSDRKGGGSINVLATDTMQWVCSCRIDSQGGVADFAWWRNGEGFVVVGKNGEVSEYEINSRTVLARWTDEGAVGTTVIALGGSIEQAELGGSRWVAVGSSSGVVNVYDREAWADSNGSRVSKIPSRPRPARAFDHLTTPTSHLEFAEDGQMLVIGSRWKNNALRLIHLPSCTVYKNWPTTKTPLGRISSLALSRDGTYLAVANEQGKIRLWQIRD